MGRRRQTIYLVLLVSGLAGCSQLPFQPGGSSLSASAASQALHTAARPVGCEQTGSGLPIPPSVSTVTSPDAPRRAISLAECICLALENGRTGEFYDRIGSDRRTSVTGL